MNRPLNRFLRWLWQAPNDDDYRAASPGAEGPRPR